MGATSRPSSQISVPSPSCPDNRQYHASSYGHEGDGGDVSPIVADLRPIPLMPRQPTISRIIVRARGGWGRRLAHRRRSPSHPPHAPTTDNITHHRTGTRGMGATSHPSSQISVPSPSCPDNRLNITTEYPSRSTQIGRCWRGQEVILQSGGPIMRPVSCTRQQFSPRPLSSAALSSAALSSAAFTGGVRGGSNCGFQSGYTLNSGISSSMAKCRQAWARRNESSTSAGD